MNAGEVVDDQPAMRHTGKARACTTRSHKPSTKAFHRKSRRYYAVCSGCRDIIDITFARPTKELSMTKPQRAIISVYCLVLAYCCLWIPWHVQHTSRFSSNYVRSGYGWLWTGPKQYCPPPTSEHSAYLCDLDDRKPEYDPDASPDLELLALRLSAATTIAAAA